MNQFYSQTLNVESLKNVNSPEAHQFERYVPSLCTYYLLFLLPPKSLICLPPPITQDLKLQA